MEALNQHTSVWQDICSVDDLVKNSGVCALVNDDQVALFTTESKDGVQVFAISNWDPIGKANVLYRGILGSIGDDIVVASPLYKQHFSLVSGRCYESDDCSVVVYDVRIVDNTVQIAA